MIFWRRLLDLPLMVILMVMVCVAMLLPAGYALALRQLPMARAFFYSGLILFVVTAMIAVATANYRPRNPAVSHLAAVIGAYLVLPVLAAVPVHQAIPGLSYVDAWFEMVSCFTTTGATVLDGAAGNLLPVHFWRALVGWSGGFFIVLSIVSVLAPMGLGGAELMVRQADMRGSHYTRAADPSQRLVRVAALFLPPYMAVTVLLWVGLLMAGDPALIALSHAMGTVSTSGISSVGGVQVAPSGVVGEALIFAALCLAVTRRFWPPALTSDRSRHIWQDPELQLASVVLCIAVVGLGLRHAALSQDMGLSGWVAHIWGVVFTTLSFLTTTGFQSSVLPDLNAAGLILVGLAIMGGGAATAAGGVKLLRVYALLRHGERELERILHPHSIGGHGPVARRLRREGAYLGWIYFMIFGLLLVGVAAALTLTGLGFDQALILSIAATTTTGQLAGVVGDAPILYGDIGTSAKAIMAAAMILGRLEILAIFAILAPNRWGP